MIQLEKLGLKSKHNLLLILDGFGYRKEKSGNAIANARMPNYRYLLNNYPKRLLKASGSSVGLPEGFMGNSEVGHITIGAGRIIKTVLSKFHDSIDNKSFFDNKILKNKFINIKNSNKSLHIIGLLSDAGVHSHEKHLFAILEFAKNIGLEKVFIHPFLDGRDTPPKSSGIYLKRLQDFMNEKKIGKIASLHGRFYAMDRDKNWDRTNKSYDVLINSNTSCNKKLNWEEALKQSYSLGITDEFLEPVVLSDYSKIDNNDTVLFFNFRADRARQIAYKLIEHKLDFISTVLYSKDFKDYKNNLVLFGEESIEETLLDQFDINKKVFIIAETEKYAHVTYFFNGGEDIEKINEKRVLVPSIKAKSSSIIKSSWDFLSQTLMSVFL